MKTAILSLVFSLVLLGCATPQIRHSQLSSLDKGISVGEAITRLNLGPQSTHVASIGKREIAFYKYEMNNGIQSDLYLLAFENNQLRYWGYIDEFRRQSDVGLSEALNKIIDEVK